ncbi:GNAT family N-acetyltransferase [Amphibacillus xylanus]|uniref:Putative acetyltransferase n=1 Tax=Amphibacillus xylanus (strain ATCC 51415 / DSM 6626 / JCM 7361 / LMG 17667 / NBRC 15112 / Ep01) TaxID=698758 RepID=K0IY48_AMPXN|nr:GNAT family N-acetyltransferase [Amphibacillus xylanus]BAM47430.1 putative acetyltransferase [Amphibacillus xylanus NBRC 15112]
MKYIEIKKTDMKAIHELSSLASKIVKEHYDPIIGKAQNDYMIEKFQSVTSILEQLAQNYQYYFVTDYHNRKIGFIAFYPRRDDLYLSKFYLEKEYRGQGIASEMFDFVKSKAQALGFNIIVLNVNKENLVAIRAYERLGLIRITEEKIDIGNGYYMDDYVYQYLIKNK